MIVLTEGKTDSRLLSKAIQITHPHLVDFIKFIEFEKVPAEPSVSALVRTVYAFIAAGVANRFVAIADNDAAANETLDKIKKDRRIPDTCRITHYPEIPLLASYPTIEPNSKIENLANINGHAGSLEMYFGRDALTMDGKLVPIRWKNYNANSGKYHGGLSKQDKHRVQQTFETKMGHALRGEKTDVMDWSGIHAIIEHIIHAFD
ncbi:hypothetical protein [Streptosporangium sandarakinum]|uniref:hypothetical protein n=1 Tax=Streptosporangium sandarakinum TaxID=1260955 RepID=UPI00371B274C